MKSTILTFAACAAAALAAAGGVLVEANAAAAAAATQSLGADGGRVSSLPSRAHWCSAAACRDGTQPPCSPPPPSVPEHPPLPACDSHRCPDDLVNSGIVGAFPDGSDPCNSTQICVKDVFPGCDCYRGDSNSEWGIWCKQTISAFDSGGVVNGTNISAHSAPTKIGKWPHFIYYFAAHGRPKYYVLYLPPTHGKLLTTVAPHSTPCLYEPSVLDRRAVEFYIHEPCWL